MLAPESLFIRPNVNVAELNRFRQALSDENESVSIPSGNEAKFCFSRHADYFWLGLIVLILSLHLLFLAFQKTCYCRDTKIWIKQSNVHYQLEKKLRACQKTVDNCKRWSKLLSGLCRLPVYAQQCVLTDEKIVLTGIFQPNAEDSAVDAIEQLELVQKPVLSMPLEGKPVHIESTW